MRKHMLQKGALISPFSERAEHLFLGFMSRPHAPSKSVPAHAAASWGDAQDVWLHWQGVGCALIYPAQLLQIALAKDLEGSQSSQARQLCTAGAHRIRAVVWSPLSRAQFCWQAPTRQLKLPWQKCAFNGSPYNAAGHGKWDGVVLADQSQV